MPAGSHIDYAGRGRWRQAIHYFGPRKHAADEAAERAALELGARLVEQGRRGDKHFDRHFAFHDMGAHGEFLGTAYYDAISSPRFLYGRDRPSLLLGGCYYGHMLLDCSPSLKFLFLGALMLK